MRDHTDDDYDNHYDSSSSTTAAVTTRTDESLEKLEQQQQAQQKRQEEEEAATLFPSRPRAPHHHTMMRRRAGLTTSIRMSVSTTTLQQHAAERERERAGKSNKVTDFAVQSIRRGSHEWSVLIQPFVSNLVFRSLMMKTTSTQQQQRTIISQQQVVHHQVRFRPYTCQAAVLFVDISGYSKIASVLTDRGAHSLSEIVNSYLSRLLHIVRTHGGDVVKFAGDAVLVVWEGGGGGTTCGGTTDAQEEDELSLRRNNVLCAARCVLEMQQTAGQHSVPETEHVFRIHAALCTGTIESEIFLAPRHTQMQRLYHLVGGDAIETLSELVDAAKAGQVCVDESCFPYLDGMATYREIVDGHDHNHDCKLLTDLQVDPKTVDILNDHIEELMIGRVDRRSSTKSTIEEDFIHPIVLDLLGHGGLAPTQIAQMRDLVVLFIAMTSNGSPVNWLLEVQSVLDQFRCPLLQVISDDKGVHAIAAINAATSVPESRVLGLEICRELIAKECGVSIGMAAGLTFCGVTGSSSVACRWDITGFPPVRAARLMQYALSKGLELAVDESVYTGDSVPARMKLIDDSVPIKGSPDPCRVFGLSEAREFAAFSLLETVHGEMHNFQTEKIISYLNGPRNRTVTLVTGPTLSGKKIVCQRAAGAAEMIPFLHVSDDSYGLLQLARTIATWMKYQPHDEIQQMALSVLDYLEKNKLTRAHDECVRLVDLSVRAGLTSCFLVDRVQFLDEFSVSIIRECLHGRRRHRSSFNVLESSSRSMLDRSESSRSTYSSVGDGRIAFLCVHVPFYNWPSARSIVQDMTRGNKNVSVPIVEVLEATLEQLEQLNNTMTNAGMPSRTLEATAEACGFCAGYHIERISAIASLQIVRQKQGRSTLSALSEDLSFRIPRGSLRDYQRVSVMTLTSEVAMRFANVFDELPPLTQTLAKVLSIACHSGFLILTQELLWEVLNDLIAEGVEDFTMNALVDEMQAMYLLKVCDMDGPRRLRLQSPALADVARDTCTPVQVRSIAAALIDRLKLRIDVDFRMPLGVAALSHLVDADKETQAFYWNQGYTALRETCEGKCKLTDINLWCERIEGEMKVAGLDAQEVIGPNFGYSVEDWTHLDPKFMILFLYRGPIGFGPLSNTLSVIINNLFLEQKVFHGATTELKQQINTALASATRRYVREVAVIEDFLSEKGLGTARKFLDKEREIMNSFSTPALNKEDITKKVLLFVEQYLPCCVDCRLNRLHQLVDILVKGPVPPFLETAIDPIREAYRESLNRRTEADSAQHALMTLAAYNWKPKPVPEHLPHLFQQTVARLRNAVVRRLSHGQLLMKRHQQSAKDLRVFLVTTGLLFEAQAEGKC